MIYKIINMNDLNSFINMINSFYEIEVLKSVINKNGRVYTMKYDTFVSSSGRGKFKCTIVCDKSMISALKEVLINYDFNKGEKNEKRR